MQDKAMTLETTRRGLEDLLLPAGAETVPIHLIASETDPALEALSEAERSWVKAQGWVGKQGSVLLLPGIGAAVFGVGDLPIEEDRFADARSVEEARARWEAEPRVRVLLESGAGAQPGAPVPSFELGFDAWPIPGTEPARWWLARGGRLSETPPEDDGADEFVYDPSRATLTRR